MVTIKNTNRFPLVGLSRAREGTDFVLMAWKRVGKGGRKSLSQSREAKSSQWKPMRAVRDAPFIWGAETKEEAESAVEPAQQGRFQGESSSRQKTLKTGSRTANPFPFSRKKGNRFKFNQFK